jgi:hypothetical protein
MIRRLLQGAIVMMTAAVAPLCFAVSPFVVLKTRTAPPPLPVAAKVQPAQLTARGPMQGAAHVDLSSSHLTWGALVRQPSKASTTDEPRIAPLPAAAASTPKEEAPKEKKKASGPPAGPGGVAAAGPGPVAPSSGFVGSGARGGSGARRVQRLAVRTAPHKASTGGGVGFAGAEKLEKLLAGKYSSVTPAYVATDTAEVRDTEGLVKAKLDKGTRVQVLAEEGGLYHVEYGDGFVNHGLVDKGAVVKSPEEALGTRPR